MSEEINFDDDLPVQDELTVLKARATQMGISYHPSIGLEKLREKVQAALDGTENSSDEEPVAEVVPVVETLTKRKMRLRKEAEKLIRIRVTCMNPAKKEWEGEIFTTGNSFVGTHTKFVPFNADEGWHVPTIIYKQLKDRKCQIFVSRKDERGNTIREGKMINEFAIEVMPDLTETELQELARKQAMARSIDK